MYKIRFLKYTMAFVLPVATWISFTSDGWYTFLPVVFGFLIVPILDALFRPDRKNIREAERELTRNDKVYDAIIYLTVPAQVFFSVFYLMHVGEDSLSGLEITGCTLSMGLMNGVFGINVAHELGHRNTLAEKWMSKVMLSTTLFLHFYIEHNRGHHRNVGTPDDPASARRGENLYAFWMRTVSGSFMSAWRIVAKERERKKQAIWSLGNEMIQYLVLELIIVAGVFYFFGLITGLLFLAAAVMGILLLETVNYIEHYGLSRKKINEHRYEDVNPIHSWNSDHVVGRLVLFELTRHSDHHFDPSKPYQILDSMPTSSQLPAGYPGMMLLSLLPPLWFRVMDPKLPA
ncbi:MAG: alkane 1-monooxygenase [Flavobacteriales bacterium]